MTSRSAALLSNNLVYSAMAVYTLAFFAHAFEVAWSVKAPSKDKKKTKLDFARTEKTGRTLTHQNRPMKIKAVRAYLKQIKLTKPYTIAYNTFSDVSMAFFEVELENGIIGYGTGSPAEDVVGESAAQSAANTNPAANRFFIAPPSECVPPPPRPSSKRAPAPRPRLQ